MNGVLAHTKEVRNACRIEGATPGGRGHLGELNINGRILLN
jgi:hypothetical protein